MQAQSRLAASGCSGGMSPWSSEGEHEAVIRELTRGRQLTARLRDEALRALRGQGQAEATAAFILQEVSRAFTVCLNIMGSPARAPPPPPEMPCRLSPTTAATEPLLAPRRNREDSIPREQKVTSSPHYDGYQWRKYGQKRITKTQFPRCYYRCSYHRERNCRATKQVQQCSAGDPPQHLVMYFNDHTCDTPAWEPEAPAANPAAAAMMEMDLVGAGGLVARLPGARGVQEEHERQVLVSTLARVLGAQQFASGTSAAAAVNVAPQRARTRDAPAPAAASSAPVVDDDAAAEMPRLDVDAVGLDVMDYDVTGELCFGDSYGLPGGGGGGGGLQF